LESSAETHAVQERAALPEEIEIMRSFRTSIVVATAVAALSWSGLSRAEDDASKKGTTKTQTSNTTKSSTTGSSSDVTDTSGSSPSTPPTTPTTTPSSNTDTSWGTGSDSAYGTGYGSTYTTTPGTPDTTSQQVQEQQPPPPTTTYSTTTTTAANYDESASADRAGYIYRPNRPMLATGLGIFAATYGASVIVGAASDRDEDKRLYIPVVGPWLDLGQRDCGVGDCGQREDWNQALLIGSGVLQGVGAGLAIASLFVPEERDRPKARTTAATKPTVRVLPVNVRGGGGVGAVGTF
jgi:hypothetical protein